MIDIVFKLIFTEITWFVFGSLVSTIWFDYDVKKMPNWWRIAFGVPLILFAIAIFVTILLTIWM